MRWLKMHELSIPIENLILFNCSSGFMNTLRILVFSGFCCSFSCALRDEFHSYLWARVPYGCAVGGIIGGVRDYFLALMDLVRTCTRELQLVLVLEREVTYIYGREE